MSPSVQSVPEGRLFIHATNVHQGGGKSLLWAVIESLSNTGSSVLLLDSRMPLPIGIRESVQIQKVSPSILQRAKAERWMANNVTPKDVVLCFGSLPPLFKLRGRTVVLVQNRYLIDRINLGGFSLRTQLRITAERLWLSGGLANADEFVVQTQTMKGLLEKMVRGRVPVRILPFMAIPDGCARSTSAREAEEKEFDFIYVASGEPHKNHLLLVEAWCLLASEGIFPSLGLTLSQTQYPILCRAIDKASRRHGLKVTNVGELSAVDIDLLYMKSGALIYPSRLESFGLPLLEARHMGLSVLAPELDYVRDVLDPEQTFDVTSALSIARAVKRFNGLEREPMTLLNATQFLEQIVGTAEGLF